MEDDLKELVLKYLENKSFKQAHDYVVRGRRYADTATDELVAGWVATMQLAAAAALSEVAQALHRGDDYEAELALRGVELPRDRVQAEINAIAQKTEALIDQVRGDPARMQQLNEGLVDDIAAFATEHEDKPSN